MMIFLNINKKKKEIDLSENDLSGETFKKVEKSWKRWDEEHTGTQEGGRERGHTTSRSLREQRKK